MIVFNSIKLNISLCYFKYIYDLQMHMSKQSQAAVKLVKLL